MVRFQSQATSLFLDSNENGHAFAMSENGKDSQNWVIENYENGILVKNVETGRYLASGFSKVFTDDPKYGKYHVWLLNGCVIEKVSHGKVLDGDNDGNVYTGNRNGGSYQNWIRHD